MYINEAGWVAIGFIVFVVFAWRFGAKPIFNLLDQRGIEIKEKLKEAEDLRLEANELLNKYKQLKIDAENDASDLLKKAQNTAEQMQIHSEKIAADTIKQKEKQVIDKIKSAESQALLDIKNLTIELSINSSEEIIKNNMTNKDEKLSLEDSIKQIS